MNDEGEQQLRGIVESWDGKVRVQAIEAMTPDASLRRYYRITIEAEHLSFDSIVAMVFDSVAPAEVGGANQNAVNADEAYVELTNFFSKNDIAVPELYHDARSDSVLLIEDLGSQALADILTENSSITDEEIDNHYRAAIDQIVAIQKTPKSEEVCAFARQFDMALYVKEMTEFVDYVLRPSGVAQHDIERVQQCFDTLAMELILLPMVLSHRDYHSWNLMIDKSNKLRVIDFQDALLAPRTYDLISLLNDRDTDRALGAKRVSMLRDYYAYQVDYSLEFLVDYHRTLLQRDLKVAGRFAKLSRERGLKQYEQWIPGTIERIHGSLAYLSEEVGSHPWGDLYWLLEPIVEQMCDT